MKMQIIEKIEIPEGIEANISRDTVSLKSGEKEIKKRFDMANVLMTKKANEIVIESKKATKREIKMIKTIKAHIDNMIKGLQEVFEYKLEAVFVHFPMTIEVDKEKKQVIIKNFFGGKKPLSCRILEGTEVEVNKNQIIIRSHNKEIAGQMAANLEKTTRLREKDRRKFQDGIYITEKAGRKI